MSIQEKTMLTCPQCQGEGEFTLFKSINTQIDPELKQKVRSGEIFQFVCPHCGASTYVNHSFLYHQPESKLMIQYVADEKQLPEFIAQLQDMRQMSAEPGVMAEMLDGLTIRLVISRADFLEKLFLFDNDFDDRLMEIIKVFVGSKVATQFEFDRLYFVPQRDDTPAHFEFLNEKSQEVRVVEFDDAMRGMYESIKRLFADQLAASGDDELVVNTAWASQWLQRRSEERQN